MWGGDVTSAERLRERLLQVMAMEKTEPFTKESAREAIRRENIGLAMCSRWPIHEGKCLNFNRLFEAVFGEPVEPDKYKEKRA